MWKRRFCAVTTMCVLTTGLASGCMNYAQSSISGRAVVATGGFLGSVGLCSDFKTATIQLAGRTVHVTETEVAWGDNHKLELPGDWQRIELLQSGRQIDILIDGAQFGKIPAGP
jgi:hypothetical protein